MKNVLSPEAKVGLFVIVGMLILAYMTLNVSDIGIGRKDGFIIYASFDSIAGVDEKAAVKIAGVEVGKVENISLKEGRAFVALRIDEGGRVFQDAVASIRAQGLMGEKYIEINAGTPSNPELEDGDTIEVFTSGGDIDVLAGKLSGIADDIKKVTTSLSNVLGDQRGQDNLEEIFQNIKDLTTNLNLVVAENQKRLGRIMTNFVCI